MEFVTRHAWRTKKSLFLHRLIFEEYIFQSEVFLMGKTTFKICRSLTLFQIHVILFITWDIIENIHIPPQPTYLPEKEKKGEDKC